MTPDEYCRQKAAASGSSLHYALLFLPAKQRAALAALCAFCKETRGIIDECSDAQVARTKLAWWRVEIEHLFERSPHHPVTKALLPHLDSCRIAPARLQQVIDGHEMDLAQTRYLDFASLSRYCGQVGGAAAAAASDILGYRNPGTVEFAANLGIALHLTRVIRNVGTDARNNRIYLPMDELKQFDVPAADILQSKHSDRFERLMAFQARRALALYAKSLDCLPREDRRAQRAGLIMAAICRATLREIERDGFRVLTQRTSLTPLRKLWLAWTTWVSA